MNIIEYAMFKIMAGKGGGNAGGGGESYPTCEIEITDQDGCGPYNITYKVYEKGSFVDKVATVPCGGVITINAVQGSSIVISGSTSGVAFYDVNGSQLQTPIYLGGDVYSNAPFVSKCYMNIYG